MLLVSIDLTSLSAADRRMLWTKVFELSAHQQASMFSIEPGLLPGAGGTLEAVIERLIERTPDPNGLRSVEGLETLLVTAGPSVVSLELYAPEGWVAGISDWGDDISVLFEPASWERLRQVLETLPSRPPYDVEEAEGRPPPLGPQPPVFTSADQARLTMRLSVAHACVAALTLWVYILLPTSVGWWVLAGGGLAVGGIGVYMTFRWWADDLRPLRETMLMGNRLQGPTAAREAARWLGADEQVYLRRWWLAVGVVVGLAVTALLKNGIASLLGCQC